MVPRWLWWLTGDEGGVAPAPTLIVNPLYIIRPRPHTRLILLESIRQIRPRNISRTATERE